MSTACLQTCVWKEVSELSAQGFNLQLKSPSASVQLDSCLPRLSVFTTTTPASGIDQPLHHETSLAWAYCARLRLSTWDLPALLGGGAEIPPQTRQTI